MFGLDGYSSHETYTFRGAYTMLIIAYKLSETSTCIFPAFILSSVSGILIFAKFVNVLVINEILIKYLNNVKKETGTVKELSKTNRKQKTYHQWSSQVYQVREKR